MATYSVHGPEGGLRLCQVSNPTALFRTTVVCRKHALGVNSENGFFGFIFSLQINAHGRIIRKKRFLLNNV